MAPVGVPSTSSSGSLCRINPDSVKCPICHEIFERPVQLGCGHVVCRGCHERLVEVSSGRTEDGLVFVRCPECRAHSTVPRTGAVECFALKGVIEQFKKQVSLDGGDRLSVLSENPSVFTCSMCREKVKAEKAFVCLTCERSNLICAECGLIYHEDHKVGRAQLAVDEDQQAALQELRLHKAQCQNELLEHRQQANNVVKQIKNLTMSLERQLDRKFEEYNSLLNVDIILKLRYNGIRQQIENRSSALQSAMKESNNLLEQISEALNRNSLELMKVFGELDSSDAQHPVQANPGSANVPRNVSPLESPTTPGRRKKTAHRRIPGKAQTSEREVPTPPEDLPTPNEEDL
ncbi:hypothetical protein QR680_004884 [Steinernema hermaphroditum]|uniref:RING-type domain-containing protein n=1 Tax=Steinernema hermaphroditum TaxID=289476 RepID=A0AA39HRK4_9BILA|nr:hypothetical protein QR680_004884 [Steinernema hermaphroditum]